MAMNLKFLGIIDGGFHAQDVLLVIDLEAILIDPMTNPNSIIEEIAVPDDFDTMAATSIIGLFEGNES